VKKYFNPIRKTIEHGIAKNESPHNMAVKIQEVVLSAMAEAWEEGYNLGMQAWDGLVPNPYLEEDNDEG
jgi:hypothetical protein